MNKTAVCIFSMFSLFYVFDILCKIPEKSNKKFWNFAKFVYMAARVTPPE
jgi:hypothetical protein